MDGAVADALFHHPEFLREARTRTLRNSITKRVVGSLYAYQAAKGRSSVSEAADTGEGRPSDPLLSRWRGQLARLLAGTAYISASAFIFVVLMIALLTATIGATHSSGGSSTYVKGLQIQLTGREVSA